MGIIDKLSSVMDTKSADYEGADARVWSPVNYDPDTDIGAAYDHVFPQVNAVVKRGKSIGLNAYEQGGEDVLEREHWLKVLFDKPGASKRSFQGSLIASYLTFPDTYILFHYRTKSKTGKPHSMELISPTRVVRKMERNIFKGYQLRDPDGGLTMLKDQEIIHLRNFSPKFGQRGYSVLDSLGKVLRISEGVDEYQAAFFDNYAIPSGAFVIEAQRTTFKNIVNEITKKHSGSGNAHTTQFIRKEPGNNSQVEYVKYQADNNTLGLGEIFERVEKRIDKAFGVPKEVMGDITNSNYAGVRLAESVLMKGTVVPILDDIADSFNFWIEANFKDTVEVISFENPVPEDLEANEVQARTNKINIDAALALAREGVSTATIKELTGIDLGKLAPVEKNGPTQTIVLPQVEHKSRESITVNVDQEGIDEAVKKAVEKLKTEIEKKKMMTSTKATELPRDRAIEFEEEVAFLLAAELRHMMRDSIDTEIDDEETVNSLVAAIAPVLLKAFAASYALQTRRAKRDFNAGSVNEDITSGSNVTFTAYVRSAARSFVNTTTLNVDTIKNQARQLNWTKRQLTKELTEYFTAQGPYISQSGKLIKNNAEFRAQRFVRSEVRRTNIRASVEAMTNIQNQTGLRIEKIWRRTGSVPEPICDELEGTVVGVEESFWESGASVEISGKQYTNNWIDMQGGDAHPGCQCVIDKYRVKS